MAKTLIVVLMCAIPPAFNAIVDIVCALGSGTSSYNSNVDQKPTSDVMQLAKRVNAAFTPVCSPKCPEIAIFRNATAANAMLVVTPDQAKLVYAPQFFASVYDKYGDGAIIAIIAHEYGHALDETYPATWMKSGWTPELRADAWSGCALARNNLTSNGVAEALTAVSKYPPSTHPAWNSRLAALRLGYTHCGGNGSKFDGAGGNKSK